MKCPRDGAELVVEMHMKIEVDRCPGCNGRWLDHHEMEHLEATVASEDQRSGMIDYAKKESELLCPVCTKPMVAFNYRAYNLELDTCADQHGYWLDAGEERGVRDVMKERVEGLARAANAEASWGQFLNSMRNPSLLDNIKNMFSGRR